MKSNCLSRILVAAGLAAGTAAAPAQLLLEQFSYPDGALTNVAAGLWNWHSGSGGSLTLNVVSGRAFIDQNDGSGGRDDYNRNLSSAFNPATDNTSSLYAGFTVNLRSLPFDGGTVIGSYFAHFKSSAANEFYARVGANLDGAAAGKFRLGISNEGWSSVANTTEFPLDLELNTDYRVILRLSLAADQATLWLDPVDESSANVTATDPIGYAGGGLINAFALRQGTSGATGGPGEVFVDDLLVGPSFAQVLAIPEPSAVALAGLLGGIFALAGWRKRR